MFEKRSTEIRDAKSGATIDTLTSYYGPAVVLIKRLGWKRLEEADDAATKRGITSARDLLETAGGADLMSQIQALVASTQPAAGDTADQGVLDQARAAVSAAKQRDPLTGYDKRTLCVIGIERIEGVPGEAGELDAEAVIDNLEPDVLTGIARAVLRLARPGLFETEADEKNG